MSKTPSHLREGKDMADPTLTWLRDLEELRKLPQRYARAIDARDIDAVGALFHPEGVVDGARGTAAVPAYLDGFRNAPKVFESSMHVLGSPLIDLVPGGDTARLDTYAVVYQLRAAGSPEGDLVLGVRYLDDVVRQGDTWVIMHRRAVSLWARANPQPPV
jgi:hypothetical protein